MRRQRRRKCQSSDKEVDDNNNGKDEFNLSLMANSNYSSEDDEEVISLSYHDLSDNFDALKNDFEYVLKLNKVLKNWNKVLNKENVSFHSQMGKLKGIPKDHEKCLVE